MLWTNLSGIIKVSGRVWTRNLKICHCNLNKTTKLSVSTPGRIFLWKSSLWHLWSLVQHYTETILLSHISYHLNQNVALKAIYQLLLRKFPALHSGSSATDPLPHLDTLCVRRDTKKITRNKWQKQPLKYFPWNRSF